MAIPSHAWMPCMKSTKMSFHANLSFVVVKMSLGIGRVPAIITPQYVTTEMIKEGLQILKSWNPQWKPTFFTTDRSSHELEAVGAVHPTCIRNICDLISTEARHLRGGWTEQQNWSSTNHKRSGAWDYEMSYTTMQPVVRMTIANIHLLEYAPTKNTLATNTHIMYTPSIMYLQINILKQSWLRSRHRVATSTAPNCKNICRMSGWIADQWVQNVTWQT